MAIDPASNSALGAGSTTLASTAEAGSILAAPGVAPLAPRYEIVAGARLGPGDELLLQASALDSRTGPVSLGLSWMRLTGADQATLDDLPGWLPEGEDGDAPIDVDLIGGSVGGSWLDRRLGVGVGLTWTRRASEWSEAETALDLVAGIAARADAGGIVSLSVANPLRHTLVENPMLVSLGLGWETGRVFRIESDLIADIGLPGQEPVFSTKGGVQVRVADRVPLRTGFQRDGRSDAWSLTAGVGIGNEQAQIDYGGRLLLGAGSGDNALQRVESQTWHGLSISLYL